MDSIIIITGQELKDLKEIRNYFGEHDATLFEHKAYAVLDSLIKRVGDDKEIIIIKTTAL